MENLKKFQGFKLLPIAALLIITPLLSNSMRFKYLYFIVNILIIAVGAQSGLLSFFLQSAENKKPPPVGPYSEISPVKERINSSPDHEEIITTSLSDNAVADQPIKKPVDDVGKRLSENIAVDKAKKLSPSTQSIFFIAGGESAHDQEEVNQEGEESVGDQLSGQELFQKSETFIGNFYKQLKIQREESWQKLHAGKASYWFTGLLAKKY